MTTRALVSRPVLPLPPTLEQELCLALLHAQRPDVACHPTEGPRADRVWRMLLYEWALVNGLDEHLYTAEQRTLSARMLAMARAELADERVREERAA
jgi:hypothetical protein